MLCKMFTKAQFHSTTFSLCPISIYLWQNHVVLSLKSMIFVENTLFKEWTKKKYNIALDKQGVFELLLWKIINYNNRLYIIVWATKACVFAESFVRIDENILYLPSFLQRLHYKSFYFHKHSTPCNPLAYILLHLHLD